MSEHRQQSETMTESCGGKTTRQRGSVHQMNATNDSDFLYEHFTKIVSETLPKDSEIRYGQHYFNVLNVLRPDIANRIRGTKLDPFHRDVVSPEVELFVSRSWSH